MTTYDVTVTLTDAGGDPIVGRDVTATLVDSNLNEVDGFVTAAPSVIVDRVDGRTDATGSCVLTLVANADITPANTYYAVRADGQTSAWLIEATASDDVAALLVATPADLGTAFMLDNLADVSASSPASGEALAWNGTAWVPTNMGTQVELDAEAAARVAGDALALAKASNLSDLASASTARTNLGLGDSATKSVGTTTGTVAAGDDSRITGAAQKASNLSDLANAGTARTNLGLGGAAVLSVGTTAGTVAAGDDSRLSDARTPTAHASSHAGAGSDAITSLGAVSFTGGISLTGTASVADRKLTMQGTQMLYYPKNADFPGCIFVGTGGGSLAAGAANLTAVGIAALSANTTGSENTAVGFSAGRTLSTGVQNVAVGDSALYYATSAGTCSAVGYLALADVTTGTANVGLGSSAGRGITTGSGNTILGAGITGLAAGLTNTAIIATGGVARLTMDATGTGFNGAAVSAKPTITGSRGGNAALADLLTKLATIGLLTDSTS